MAKKRTKTTRSGGGRKKAPRKGTAKKSRVKKKTKKNYFIAGAVKHPGSFTRYCVHEGYGGPSMACIHHAMTSGNLHRERQAVLARTFKRLGAARHARSMHGY